MRLHEAAPKLIIQEQVGDKMKLLSYCPVASLTRAALTLGQLHMAHCPPALYTCLVHECKLLEGVEYYLPRYFSIRGYADCHRRHIPPPVNFSPWMKRTQFKSFEIVGWIRLANIIASLGHANTEG